MNTPNNRFQRKTKYEQKDLSKSKSKSKINCYYPNEETNFKENKTHFKHHSNPNIIHHIFEDKQIRREKNTSFHTKCDQNIKNHVLTNNLIGNTYLPHVKTKQTMIEYELFKKQKKSNLVLYFFPILNF